MKPQLDSDKHPPTFISGDKVWVFPARKEATVIQQFLHYDCGESFWGNVEVKFSDGIKGIFNCWQIKTIETKEDLTHLEDTTK